MDRQAEDIGYFDALFGLITRPAETTELLLAHGRPRHTLSLLFTVVFLTFSPLLYYVYKYGGSYYNPRAVYGLMLIFFCCYIIFVILEGIVLAILGIETGISSVFASVAYCLTPLVMVLFLIYVFNYLHTGNLSFITTLLTTTDAQGGRFLQVIPYAVIIAQINVVLVFAYALKTIGDLHPVSTIFITMFSVIPFLIALAVSLKVADTLLPGSHRIFKQVLESPVGLLAF